LIIITTLIALTMQTVRASETSACLETTRGNIPESCHLHTRRRENLKSHKKKPFFLLSEIKNQEGVCCEQTNQDYIITAKPAAVLKFLHYLVITGSPTGIRFKVFVDKAIYRFPVSTEEQVHVTKEGCQFYSRYGLSSAA
jgi:hypothetical protein